jgi:hypothetical protein
MNRSLKQYEIRNALQKLVAPAAAAATKYANTSFGVDVCFSNEHIDYPYLKEMGVEFAMVRGGQAVYEDPMLAEHIQGFHDAGIPAGVYWVHDPQWYVDTFESLGKVEELTWDTDPVIQQMKKSLAHKTFYWLSPDIEKWWQNSAQYQLALQNKIPWDQVKRIAPSWCNKTARWFCEHCGDAFKGKPTIPYTAKWYIEGYATYYEGGTKVSPYDWLVNYDAWECWVSRDLKAAGTWEGLRGELCPPDTYKPTGLNARSIQAAQIYVDEVFPNGKFGTAVFDINMLMYPLDQFYQLIGYSGTTPVEPPVTPGDNGGGDTPVTDLQPVLDAIAALQDDVDAARGQLTAIQDKLNRRLPD